MALELLDNAIADFEARLNLKPGEAIPKHLLTANPQKNPGKNQGKNAGGNKKGEKQQARKQNQPPKNAGPNLDQPDICKLEFKVGKIVKVRKLLDV